MAIKTERLHQIVKMANDSVNSLRVGHIYPGPFGAAVECGITDYEESRAFAVVWDAGWQGLRGVYAITEKNSSPIVISISTP